MKPSLLLAASALVGCSSHMASRLSAGEGRATRDVHAAESLGSEEAKEIDRGRGPFPTIAQPAPLERVDLLPQAPSAPPSPPLFASSGGDFYTSDHEAPIASKTVAAYCGARRCKELPLPVFFAPDRTYLGLKAIRVIDDDGSAWSTLLVKTAAGLAPTDVYWEVVDPEDPGCPSTFRGVSVELARIENGQLIIVMLGDSTTYVEVPEPKRESNHPDAPLAEPVDSGARLQLVREITIVKLEADTVRIRDYPYWSGPALGYKLQPRNDKFIPWSHLSWKARRDFKIDQDGGLELSGRDPNQAP